MRIRTHDARAPRGIDRSSRTGIACGSRAFAGARKSRMRARSRGIYRVEIVACVACVYARDGCSRDVAIVRSTPVDSFIHSRAHRGAVARARAVVSRRSSRVKTTRTDDVCLTRNRVSRLRRRSVWLATRAPPRRVPPRRRTWSTSWHRILGVDIDCRRARGVATRRYRRVVGACGDNRARARA